MPLRRRKGRATSNKDDEMRDEEIEGIIAEAYGAKATTRANYEHRLMHLRDNVFGGTNKTMYGILSDAEGSYQVIRKRYPNISTRKNVLTVILALFKHSERLREELKDEMEKWREFHGHMDSFQEAKYKKHLPDAKQLAKYTPFEDIERKYAELRKGDPHGTLAESLQFVLLSVVVSTPPKRSDYGKMAIYYDRDPNVPDANYVVIRRPSEGDSYMVFNKYKTAKQHHRVDQELPRKTTRDIVESLRRHPRKYLFVNKFGKPYETNNAFGKFVTRAFRANFGRDTGVTMLRHIFITEKLSFDEMDDDELESVARKMMHGTQLQRKYNWNKNAICRTICQAR